MLIWVLNWAGQLITHPAQALDCFLCYFSSFDWSCWAITVFGPVSASDLSDDLNLCDVMRLPVQLYSEHVDVYADSRDSYRRSGYLPVDLLTLYTVEFEHEVDSRLIKSFPNTVPGGQSSYCCGSMNVMDCVRSRHSLTSCVDECLLRIFQQTVVSCRSALQHVSSVLRTQESSGGGHDSVFEGSADSAEGVQELLALIHPRVSRFAFSRQDGLMKLGASHTQEHHTKNCFDVDDGALNNSIRHAELVLFLIVDPDALIDLVKCIPQHSGPQLVREVRKKLQIAAGAHVLSLFKCHTQFPGLKALIGHYSHIVRLGTDHQFNPHVYLVDGKNQSRAGSDVDDSDSVASELTSNSAAMTYDDMSRTYVAHGHTHRGSRSQSWTSAHCPMSADPNSYCMQANTFHRPFCAEPIALVVSTRSLQHVKQACEPLVELLSPGPMLVLQPVYYEQTEFIVPSPIVSSGPVFPVVFPVSDSQLQYQQYGAMQPQLKYLQHNLYPTLQPCLVLYQVLPHELSFSQYLPESPDSFAHVNDLNFHPY